MTEQQETEAVYEDWPGFVNERTTVSGLDASVVRTDATGLRWLLFFCWSLDERVYMYNQLVCWLVPDGCDALKKWFFERTGRRYVLCPGFLPAW